MIDNGDGDDWVPVLDADGRHIGEAGRVPMMPSHPSSSLGSRVHELKCDPVPFQALYLGSKTFEVRVNDRGYRVGDTLHIREYDRATGTYSGRWISKRVTYLLPGGKYGMPENLCVMSLA